MNHVLDCWQDFLWCKGQGCDGTIAPWAAVASLPFAPEIVLPTIEHMIHMGVGESGCPYGLAASFNATFQVATPLGWVSPWNYGLNQGPLVLMVENYRSGLIWELMRKCPYLVTGLRRAGFSGGWLEPVVPRTLPGAATPMAVGPTLKVRGSES